VISDIKDQIVITDVIKDKKEGTNKCFMSYSSIRDNHSHGTVGDFLKQAITNNSIVSAYFTIYAYHQLKDYV
jgi:hypothetical protein